MQLVAFRVQNFRSIVDTGWHQLAHDNITSLIGQNESGKTSILEALKAFHDGNLIEDMLRSDLSLPNVTCQFSFSLKEIEKRIARVDDLTANKAEFVERLGIPVEAYEYVAAQSIYLLMAKPKPAEKQNSQPAIAGVGGACEAALDTCQDTSYGTLTCLEIDSCIGACGDATCSNLCVYDGAAASQDLYIALNSCANTECPTGDPTCYATVLGAGGACETEMTDCSADN